MENRFKYVAGAELFDHLAKCVADFITKVAALLHN